MELIEKVEVKKKNYYAEYMENLGMTKEAWRVFNIANLLQFIWGCEACFISINMTNLGEHKGISTEQISLSICLLYTMMGFGSLMVGITTKHVGRIFTLQLTTILYVVFTFICSILPRPLNFYHVLFFRCLSNISIGIFNIVILNLLSEFLPITNRSFILMVNSGFYNFGNFFLIILNNLIFPGGDSTQKTLFKSTDWRLVNSFTTIPGIISIVILFVYARESPLFLLNKNRETEAFHIIDEMSKSKNIILTEEDKERIKSSVVEKKNYNLNSDYRELFYKEYRYLTFGSLLICSICYLNMIGISYLVPKSIDALGNRTYNLSYNNQLLIYGLLQLPNGFIGGYMTESDLFGRKGTMTMSAILCGAFYLIIYVWPKFLCFYAGEVMLFNSIAFGGAFIYVTEVFPTNLRDQAQSFIQFFSFLLGSWSPYLIDYLPDYLVSYFVLGLTNVVCAGIAHVLPIETKKRALDEDL
jgi:MFS family permease